MAKQADNKEEAAKNDLQNPAEEAVPEKAVRDKKGIDKKQAAKAGAAGAKLAAAEQRAEKAEGKAQEAEGKLLRVAAEYDNFRKRSQREQEAAFGNGVGHAAEELLPVLDTLEAAANVQSGDEEYKKGVVLTLSKCAEVFKKLGIEEIEAQGQAFDPELHNAVMQEEAPDTESGTVTKVLQKGYTLHGRVLRHAMVAVSA